ncbi:MAG: GNAT family N-acetyltransferase [Bdellovibrionota bacterium]
MKKKAAWKPKKPYLELRALSKRLEARPYQLSDFAAWHGGQSGRQEKQHRFDGPKPKAREISLAAFRKRVMLHRQTARARTHFQFGLFERKTGRVVGHVGFYLIHAGMRWANLGYGIHNQFWGKGYGPEGARLVLGLGFGPLDFHRIEASCEVGNKASAKTAIRAGLKREGRRTKFFAHKGGVDMLVFAQNQLDWRRRARK